MEQGLLHLYYGDGKGKTTAAMGLALRALGSGKRVVIVQFLKGGNSGEIPLLAKLGAEIYRGKAGQKFVFQMNEAEKAATRELQNRNLRNAMARLADLLVLDEAGSAWELDMVDKALLHVTAPIADGGGVVGVRKNNHFRLRRQSGFKGFNVELIAIFLINRNTDNLAAEDLGVLEVIRVTGVNDHDLVAIVDKRQHRIEKCGVRTGGNKDVALRDDIQAIEPLEFFCQLTLEPRIANWHGIMAC